MDMTVIYIYIYDIFRTLHARSNDQIAILALFVKYRYIFQCQNALFIVYVAA